MTNKRAKKLLMALGMSARDAEELTKGLGDGRYYELTGRTIRELAVYQHVWHEVFQKEMPWSVDVDMGIMNYCNHKLTISELVHIASTARNNKH